MSELPTEISVAEQAAAAGRIPGKILRPGENQDIDEMRNQVRAFINTLPEGRARSLAYTKLDEMDFWMRETRRS
jgi:hypothetical protein